MAIHYHEYALDIFKFYKTRVAVYSYGFPPMDFLCDSPGSLVVGALHLIQGETSYPLRKKLLGSDQLRFSLIDDIS